MGIYSNISIHNYPSEDLWGKEITYERPENGFTFAGWYSDPTFISPLPTYNDNGINKWQLRIGTANSNNTFNVYAKWQ